MSIWIGHDGTLNDDDGDGPAVVSGSYSHATGQDYFVGADDFGSSLGDIGSSLGSAFGGDSGGSSGGSGGLGSLFGTDAGSGSGGGSGALSSLSNLFGSDAGSGGGSGDTGSTIANLFGQVAKVAVPAVTKAIASSQKPSSQGSAAPSAARAPSASSAPPNPSPMTHPSASAPKGQAAHVSQHRKALDPKARLNLVLTHLAKKYGLPTPDGAPGSTFVSKMMAPKPDASTVASGVYVGALDDLLEDLSGAFHHDFSRHPHVDVRRERTYTVPSWHMRGHAIPFGEFSQYGQSQYAQPQYAQSQYAEPQYSQPQHAQPQYVQSPYAQTQHAPPVTYSHDAAYDQAAAPRMTEVHATATRKVKPVSTTDSDDSAAAKLKKFTSKMMGGSAYGDSTGGKGGRKSGALVLNSGGGANEGVRHTQQLLNAYWQSKVLATDGKMGGETIKFLKEFQRQQGLPITGVDDAATHALLETTPLAWGTPGGDAASPLDASSSTSNRGSHGSFSDDASDWAEAFKKTGQFWTQPPPLTIAQQIAAESKKK